MRQGAQLLVQMNKRRRREIQTTSRNARQEQARTKHGVGKIKHDSVKMET